MLDRLPDGPSFSRFVDCMDGQDVLRVFHPVYPVHRCSCSCWFVEANDCHPGTTSKRMRWIKSERRNRNRAMDRWARAAGVEFIYPHSVPTVIVGVRRKKRHGYESSDMDGKGQRHLWGWSGCFGPIRNRNVIAFRDCKTGWSQANPGATCTMVGFVDVSCWGGLRCVSRRQQALLPARGCWWYGRIRTSSRARRWKHSWRSELVSISR